MKINLVDVVYKIMNWSDRDHLVTMMGHGMWELNGVVVRDYNKEYEVQPGDVLKLWWHPEHREKKMGGTFVYFAPAVLEDLHILGVKTPGLGRSRKSKKTPETVVLPPGLTLDNHRDLMGKRFKMTKQEIQKFGAKNREDAFKSRYNRHPTTGEKL